MAGPEDLGTLRIGISADTSELDAALKGLQAKVRGFQIPEVAIRVRIRTPDDAAMKAAQNKIAYTLKKAQTLGVELTPTLTVKNANIAGFRNEIQRLMSKQQALAVPISADVDGPLLKAQILKELGVVDIPLTWHWAGEPPPGDVGGGGIGIPRGGGGKGGGGGGGAAAAPVPSQPAPTPPSTAAPAPKIGAAAPVPGKAGPAVSAPTTAKQSQQAAPPKAPVVGVATPAAPPLSGGAPKIGEAKPTGTFTKPTQTEEEIIEQRVLDVVNKLQRGRPQGITRLMEMGAVLSPEGTGVVRAKQRSQLAKYLKGKPEGLEGIDIALSTYQQALAREEKIGRPAFTGGALSLAGERPQTSDEAINLLRAQIEKQAKERAAEFRKRPDVQQFKQAFQEQGFAAFGGADAFTFRTGPREGESAGIGSGLLTAQGLIETNPTRAREIAVETLTMFFSLFPKQAGRLFPNDPGRVKGALSPSKKPRGVRITEPTITNEAGEEVPNPKYDPALEAVGSAISAIFSDITTKSLPRRDERARAERKFEASTRNVKPEGVVSPGLIEEQTARRQREEEAFALTRRGLSRARNPEAEFSPGAQFLSALPDRRRRFGKFGRQFDVANRLFSLRQESLKGPLNPDEILELMKKKGYAGGGPILKSGGLMARLAKQGIPLPENAVVVGEKGPELFVPKEDGHIIDNEGRNLPEWIRRSKTGENKGKDLTGRMRAAGGPVRGAVGGAFRSFVPGEKEAIAANVLAAGTSGSVQRVFVVNWPAGFTRPPAQSTPTGAMAGGPVTLDQLGQLLNIATGVGGGGGARGTRPRAAKAAAAGPATATTTRGLGAFSALEEAQLEAQRQDLITAQRLRLKEVAAQISAAIREAPTRGLQTATGEVAAINLGGLRGVIGRRRIAEEAQVRATAALNSWAAAQEKAGRTQLKLSQAQDPKKIQELTLRLEDQEKAVDFLGQRYEGLAAESEKLGKGVISTSDKLKVFGANTLGIIGGTLLFGASLTAAQGAIGALTTAFGPLIERATGFRTTSAQVASALKDQAQAAGGAMEATADATLAQAGFSTTVGDAIRPLLVERATIEAGNTALANQLTVLHAAQAFRQEEMATRAGQPAGLFQPAGGIPGVTRATGGLFGTPVGATPSLFEQLEGEAGTQPIQNIPEMLMKSGLFGVLGQALAPQPKPILRGEEIAGLAQAGEYEAAQEEAKRTLAFADSIQLVDDSLRKVSSKFDLVAQGVDQVWTPAIQKASNEALKLAGVSDEYIAVLDRQRIAVIDTTDATRELRRADITQFGQDVQTGMARPSADYLLRQMEERLLPNQLAAFQAEAQYQTQTAIPAQRALEFLNAPPMPFGAGIVQIAQGTNGALPFGPGPISGLGPNAPAVDPTATASFNEYRSVAQSALDAVIAKAREGRQALLSMGIPPQLITELETLGNAAQGIELGLANRQAAVAAAQYNHQLYILNRNLADAMALAGMQVGAAGRLGKLQRENFELSKKQNALQIQAQELSLALSQRQINFQRAIAGFVSPGETAEERAARIEQAKIEADYAQKQLDIQKELLGLGKKQFVLGVQIFDATAQRQVQDLQFALADLKQARALQLDTTAAQQALQAIRARQAQINSEVAVGIEKATKTAALRISTALDIANKSGETFANILITVGTAFNKAVQIAFSTLTGYAGSGGNNKTQGNIPLASGIIGDTLGPTNVTVGEAGREKVAVVKNPRNVSLRSLAGVAPSDGGGVMIYVDVHDNAIKDEGSIDALVAKISRAVESSINRKTSLLGLRTT